MVCFKVIKAKPSRHKSTVHRNLNKKPNDYMGNKENSLRPKRRRPGSLPDTRVKEAGDRHTCRDLEHQCDTRRPPRLDRNRFANPPELFTDTPRFARAQILTSLRRNPNRSSPLHLHAGEFYLSKEVSSDFESHQTLDRRAENHRSSSLERRHHRFADARTIEPPPKPLFFKPSYLYAENIIDLLRDLLRLKRAASNHTQTPNPDTNLGRTTT
ncbi:unnamed protein product [Brassica rapa]|uniref:Uncharacterized protein n=1 Tax=Brassica campestris TaxID=3711 RepID=A0A8D9HAA3_BRACM|nr:unnamed protein product [Brassica rapa]